MKKETKIKEIPSKVKIIEKEKDEKSLEETIGQDIENLDHSDFSAFRFLNSLPIGEIKEDNVDLNSSSRKPQTEESPEITYERTRSNEPSEDRARKYNPSINSRLPEKMPESSFINRGTRDNSPLLRGDSQFGDVREGITKSDIERKYEESELKREKRRSNLF